MFSKIINLRIDLSRVRRSLLVPLALGSAVLTGCASSGSGQSQSIYIETRDDGQLVTGVGCELKNSKGRYFVTSPATVTVQKAYQDLRIRCEKAKLQPGTVVLKSKTSGMGYGKAIFGGLLGSAYDYPEAVTVEMGQTQFIPPRAPTPEEAAVIASDKLIKRVPPEPEIRTGVSSAAVERLAKAIGCNTPVGAGLLTAPGPIEEYEVKCDIGGVVKARCELRQCQLQ